MNLVNGEDFAGLSQCSRDIFHPGHSEVETRIQPHQDHLVEKQHYHAIIPTDTDKPDLYIDGQTDTDTRPL